MNTSKYFLPSSLPWIKLDAIRSSYNVSRSSILFIIRCKLWSLGSFLFCFVCLSSITGYHHTRYIDTTIWYLTSWACSFLHLHELYRANPAAPYNLRCMTTHRTIHSQLRFDTDIYMRHIIVMSSEQISWFENVQCESTSETRTIR